MRMAFRNYALDRYWHKKHNSFQRGIPFHLTFDEWYNWWLSNGIDYMYPRGKITKNSLCMCRFNDIGPYALNNIYCATLGQNTLDSIKIKKRTPPRQDVTIQTPYGLFGSIKDAAKQLNMTVDAIHYRLRTKSDWYRV